MLWWQVRQILRADFPALRAVEGVAVVVPFFLCVFAAIYVLMSEANSANFTEPLTRTGALYLSIVVFGTVGFGDIAADHRRFPPGRERADPVRFGLPRRRPPTLPGWL